MTSTIPAEEPSKSPVSRLCRLDGLLVSLLIVLLGGVFYLSPVRHISDSRYTMLLGEELLLHQSFDLSRYFVPYDSSHLYKNARTRKGLPRHVKRNAGRLFHVYPYGSSVLSMPFLAALRGLGHSTITVEGRYSSAGEMRVQAFLASIIATLTGLVFYGMARQLLPPGWSLAVTLAAAFGSQLWSVASRVLWSHTWGLLLLSLALLVLLRGERVLRSLGHARMVLLATLVSWAFFVRPTAVVYIVPITLFMMWRYRQRSWTFLATGFVWLSAFIVHSRVVFGQPLPIYYRRGNDLGFDTLALGLEANLVSPGRGLLVYSPWLLLVIYLVARHGRRLQHRALVVTALSAMTLHLLVVSGNRNWWAGSCYGPRFMTETIPLWVLLCVIGWGAALDHLAALGPRVASLKPRHVLLQAAAVALLIPSWTFHGAGALSKSWVGWNSVPEGIPWQPMRVFDWQEAQFLWALDPQRVVQHRRAADRANGIRPKLARHRLDEPTSPNGLPTRSGSTPPSGSPILRSNKVLDQRTIDARRRTDRLHYYAEEQKYDDKEERPSEGREGTTNVQTGLSDAPDRGRQPRGTLSLRPDHCFPRMADKACDLYRSEQRHALAATRRPPGMGICSENDGAVVCTCQPGICR